MRLRQNQLGGLPLWSTDFSLACLKRQGDHLDELSLRQCNQGVHEIAIRLGFHQAKFCQSMQSRPLVRAGYQEVAVRGRLVEPLRASTLEGFRGPS